jgi:hypothetical protein
MVKLFHRLGFILIAIVGLIFLVVGGWLLVSQSWDQASGTVGQCQTRTVHTQPGKTTSRVEQVCDVTWAAGGSSHTATITMGQTGVVPGEIVDLRVLGETAVLATPMWMGVGSAGLGIVLIVVAFVMRRRARKAQ